MLPFLIINLGFMGFFLHTSITMYKVKKLTGLLSQAPMLNKLVSTDFFVSYPALINRRSRSI